MFLKNVPARTFPGRRNPGAPESTAAVAIIGVKRSVIETTATSARMFQREAGAGACLPKPT